MSVSEYNNIELVLGSFPRQEDSIIDIINYTFLHKGWLYIVLENKALKTSYYSSS